MLHKWDTGCTSLIPTLTRSQFLYPTSSLRSLGLVRVVQSNKSRLGLAPVSIQVRSNLFRARTGTHRSAWWFLECSIKVVELTRAILRYRWSLHACMRTQIHNFHEFRGVHLCVLWVPEWCAKQNEHCPSLCTATVIRDQPKLYIPFRSAPSFESKQASTFPSVRHSHFRPGEFSAVK